MAEKNIVRFARKNQERGGPCLEDHGELIGLTLSSHLACEIGGVELVRMLIDRGDDLDFGGEPKRPKNRAQPNGTCIEMVVAKAAVARGARRPACRRIGRERRGNGFAKRNGAALRADGG